MTLQADDPTSIMDLLEPVHPPVQQIALHVTVTSRHGHRAYWMTENGAVFFRRLDGQLRRASSAQAHRIARGLEMARRSDDFVVTGRVVNAVEAEIARGLHPDRQN